MADCPSCSSAADQIPARLRQLHVRNTTLVAVTPAPYDKIAAFRTFGRGIEAFHYGIPYLDLTALGRQEAWEEPKGRTIPLGLHVGGPNIRLPDEYDEA
jgi:predicted dithiol-disulfide oxidoreductase (DUF899 family)